MLTCCPTALFGVYLSLAFSCSGDFRGVGLDDFLDCRRSSFDRFLDAGEIPFDFDAASPRRRRHLHLDFGAFLHFRPRPAIPIPHDIIR